MTERAFVSYARDDGEFVLRLAAGLRGLGVPLWLDQWDIPAGGDWDQAIDRGLHDCGRFLIVLSPAAVASQQVRGELQVALDEGKTIVPLLYKPCAVPRVLRLIQHIDATTTDRISPALLDVVAQALGRPASGAPPGPQQPPPRAGGHRFWPYVLGATLALSALTVVLLDWRGAPTPVRGTKPVEHGPEYPGRLQISANVDDVRVLVDGVEVGTARRTAPLFLTGIRPGRRRVGVSAPGFEDQEQWVNVPVDQWARVGFVLNPLGGR